MSHDLLDPTPPPQNARNLKHVLSLRIYMAEGEQQPEEGAVVEPHLVFDIYCDVGVLKRHIFQLQDCEIVHALFHREGTHGVPPPFSLSLGTVVQSPTYPDPPTHHLPKARAA